MVENNNIPPITPRANERKLINLAMKLAEKQLRDGTASAQVISHFLRLATVKEELELERIRSDISVAKAKEKQMESASEIKKMFEDAINAMKSYGPPERGDEYE